MIGELDWSIHPTALPLDVEDMKMHSRVSSDAEDRMIRSYIQAATDSVEAWTGHRCVCGTHTLTFRSWHGNYIVLPGYPLVSISSITYVDEDSETQTVATTVYGADVKRRPGRAYLLYDQSWPSNRGWDGDVTVTFVAGHLTPFTAVASTDVITATGRTFTDGDRVRLSLSGGFDAALPGGLAERTDYFVRDQSGATFKLAATSGGDAIDITDAGAGSFYVGVLPGPIYQSIRNLAALMIEQREPVVTGTIATKIPHTLEAMLWTERIMEQL